MVRPSANSDVQLPLAPSLARRRLQVYLLLLISDGLAIFGGFSLAGYLYLGEWTNRLVMLEAQLVIPIYWTAAIARNAYSAATALDARTGIIRAALALGVGVATVTAAAYFLKASENFSRVISASGMALSLALLAASRDNWVHFVRKRCGETATNFLLITDGCEQISLPNSYHVDARKHGLVPDILDPRAMDRLAQFLANMDHVLVHCHPDRRADWAKVLKGTGIRTEIVYEAVSEIGAMGAHVTQDYCGFVVAVGPLGLRNRILKRGFDLVLATIGFVVLLPLMLGIALAIKLEDRGPALFVQPRVGRNNRFFSIYKFRSMRRESLNAAGSRLVVRDDPRVTRVGRLIRATSLDELPQLVNIIQGDMSLVGPRPHALGSKAGQKLYWEVDQRYWHRHSLKPGLTGLAQVRGFRGGTDQESDLASRLNADLEYLDGWTLWRDIAIIFATAKVAIHRDAY